jgi:hypothetical protein
MNTLYKVLVDGKSCHGGNMKWSLPKNGKPGKWQTVSGELRICSRGIHLTTAPYSRWAKFGMTVYEAEAKEIGGWEGDKCVCRAARLLREVEAPQWWARTISHIEMLKDFRWCKPDGNADPSWKVFYADNILAARDAARDAASNAAGDAAWYAAKYAAGDAAGDAAWYAAWDAAWGSARAAARAAAWYAARDAAWYAARDAASNAARDAAWYAAWYAAWDAARDAALMAICLTVADLPTMQKNLKHAESRMEVWRKGYCLHSVINGIFYVYAVNPQQGGAK